MASIGASSANQRHKFQIKEDRISDLPDPLIHYILSFLPSTKQSIQTGILSKRWKKQWTQVPVLIFDSTGKSDKNFSQSIDHTLMLHDCVKIKKFHIQYDCDLDSDPQLTSKILFATRKYVEELILHLEPLHNKDGIRGPYKLPEFLFSNDSLVKLELFKCCIVPNFQKSINWARLKELKLECSRLRSSAIENVLSGSPSLESLELISCTTRFENHVVIASKSLKRLIVVDVRYGLKSDDQMEISCPNLEEFSVKISKNLVVPFPGLPDKTIENVLSESPLLHTLELLNFGFSNQLFIASKSLKKLVLGEIYYGTKDFEISSPNIEQLNLYRFVPDAFYAFKDYKSKTQWERNLAMNILGQLQHVKLLEIGRWFIKILHDLELEVLSSMLLNCKYLTLDGSNFDVHLRGIVCVIRSSPVLEKLVIKLRSYKVNVTTDCRKKNYWNSNVIVFNCLVSNLKTVKIVGLSKRNYKCKNLFNFLEFLLKNASILEKIIIVLRADCGKDFLLEASKKLLSLARCYPKYHH